MKNLEGSEPINVEQHIDCYHMFSPVDWRWDLARKIAEGEISDPGEMSRELSATVDFLRRQKPGEARLTEHDHRIAAALELYQQDTPLRWEVEARLLAKETDSAIAEKTGVPETTITIYEPLFYNVRDYLHATDYLLGATVDFAHFRGFRNHEVRQFWAWAAMAGGPVIVDLMVQILHEARRDGEPPGLLVYLRRGACDLMIQTFIALQVIPPEADALWFFDLSTRLQLAKKSASPVAETNKIHRALVRCARKILETCKVPDPPDWWTSTNTSPADAGSKPGPAKKKSKGKSPSARSSKKKCQAEEPIGSK